jgi:hypothetical protein
MDDNTMVMPVSPMGNNNWGGGLFGGDASWIIIFLFALMFGGFGGGWGMNGFGGFGGMWGAEGMFPWLLASNQQTNGLVTNGFDNAATMSAINGVQNSVTSGFGDVQTALCGGFAGVNASINGAQNAIAQQLYTNQIADLERSYAAQTASMNGFNNVGLQLCQASADNRLATANIGADIAREACATRTSDTANTQLILNAINDGFRNMSDQRYQDKIDAKNDEIAQLRQENLYARGQASQDNQTSVIRAGQATTANQLIAEMRACPIPSMPVYGQTPIFTCNNNGCGCGCNGNF